MIKNNLENLAQTITGDTIAAASILDALNAIATYYAGETVTATSISDALKVIDDNYQGGGGGGGDALQLYCYEARDANTEESELYYFYTSKEITADGDYLFYKIDQGTSPYEDDYIQFQSIYAGDKATVYKNDNNEWIVQAPFGGGAYDYTISRQSAYNTSLI